VYNTYFLFSFTFSDPKLYLPRFNSLFNYSYIGYIPINSSINFIRPLFTSAVRMVKSFGSKATILSYNSITSNYVVRLPSGILSFFFILTKAVRLFTKARLVPSSFFKKAGFSNLKGFRPKVRGVAKNPVDHPHGGRTKSIRLPLTPWGFVTKKKN
jgi:large subunit ribosomal protein L2